MVWMSLALAGPVPEGSPYPDVPFFHHGSLVANKRVEATYPAVDDEAQRVRHRCMVWVKIGSDGRPAEVTIVPEFPGEGCTAPFQGAAKEAVTGWKWKPKKIGKDKAVVQTQIVEVFAAKQVAPVIDVSRDGSPPPQPVPQPKRPE